MSSHVFACAVMSDIGTAPLQVVGYEGVFGCLAMFCVLLPLVQHTPGQDGSGLHEDSWETWHVRLLPRPPPPPPIPPDFPESTLPVNAYVDLLVGLEAVNVGLPACLIVSCLRTSWCKCQDIGWLCCSMCAASCFVVNGLCLDNI